MDIQDFSRRMIELLPKCIRGFQGYESNYLSRGQISLPQFWALEYLSRHGHCLMSELAVFLGISRPAATGLINRLIAQKLVDRRSEQKDRRTVRVSISAKGKKIVTHVWQQKRRGMETVFAKISAAERKQYLDILEKVVNNFSPKILIGAVVLGAAFVGADCGQAQEAPLANLTLRQAYELALKRSETLAIQKQVIEEAHGRLSQTISRSLPQVSFTDTEKFQDRFSSSSSSENSSRVYVPTRTFTFSQPLFSGFREFAAIAANKAERKQREQELERAKQLLFTDVSDAFYLSIGYQQQLGILLEVNKVLQGRSDELSQRLSIGRSRPSEVANTESKFYQNEADIESLRGQQDSSFELMEFLVGHKIESLAETKVLPAGLPTREEYLARVAQRADVLAAKHASVAAEKNITVQRAGYFPSVNVTGNSYLKRVGPIGDSDWDVTVNISVPLFNAKETAGAVTIARAQAEQAKLRLSQAQRQADLDIKNAYTNLSAGMKRMEAYHKAVQAAEKNYALQSGDYTKSLVNNLDVLQALEDLQSVRGDYISVKNETQRAYWSLKVAAGDISDDTL